MLLTIDIGNTNITMGIYEGDELLFTSRLATDRKRTSDQYSVELLNISTHPSKNLFNENYNKRHRNKLAYNRHAACKPR